MNSYKSKISLILVGIISFLIIFCNSVFAVEANIVATSVNVGENVTVTVTLPNECNEYEGRIKVIFADGTEKISDMKKAATNNTGLPGNEFTRTITYTVKADVAGNATAQMYDIVLGDGKGNKINTKDVVQTGFKVSSASTNTVSNEVSNKVDSNTVKNEVKEKEEIKVVIKEEVNKTMYVAEDVSSCNVRNADSKKAEIIGGLRSGAEVKVTGITSNGWYRIKYYADTAYVADVLTDKKPDKNKNEVSNKVENKVDNKINNKVENKVENSINNTNEVVENNTQELDKLKNEIGVIPEVGNNIADVLFVIVTVFSIGYIVYIVNRNKDIEV